MKSYKPTTIQRSSLVLTEFVHFVERWAIYCGKLAKIPPSQHKAVRLACDRGAAGIYEAHLRTIEGKRSRDEGWGG
jgi:hypothetical protein